MTTRRVPRATYRVQLHGGFTLWDAADVVPYLAALGVSHLYASPVLQARPGSTHGYDVVDHGRVNEELGGAPALDRVTDALRAHGMGLVLDIVPNHMAIHDPGNAWWWDLLEHGPASRYASHFDVDWDPPESRLRNVILLPVLPDHYGRVLEAGDIRIARRGPGFVVTHGELAFPLDPQSLGALVTAAGEAAESDELGFIGSALSELPPATTSDPELVARRQRDAEVLGQRLEALVADAAVAAALDVEVARRNGDVDALDALLEEQNYRLAWWRTAARDLGYRRFFDIDELIGLRAEDPQVFADTHRLLLDWVNEGRVDGLRIDHPDGLRDPASYFRRLRAAAPDAWIVAEKILEADEPIPTDWAIDGTTGYRFANEVLRLLVEPDAEAVLSRHWADLADVGPGWEEVAAEARTGALTDLLGSDLNRLTDLFLAVCEANRRYRDFTRHELHEALREVAAELPVYRTYVRAADRHVDPRDARLIDDATSRAAERRADLDAELFTFLGRILRLEVPGPLAAELAMRFQQLTPAAMAKGIEDTAFYRHHRLVALNEVGGDPGWFAVSAEAFHRAMTDAADRWPDAMLTLSTHDTKRSADVRARLAVLTEDAERWAADASRLLHLTTRHRTTPQAPTDADAYLFMQTVVGAWPIDADRTAAYLEKATREAKLHTSWTDPDPAYDEAVQRFVRESLADPGVTDAIEELVAGIRDAGWRAALAQLTIQLTAPGVPDVYQGGELWDLSLVDPDNRRPVDYDLRRRLLAELRELSAAQAWERRDSGGPKLWLLTRALEVRERCSAAVRRGEYRPLPADGPVADAALAFARGSEIITVVTRRPRRIERDGWGATSLRLPDGRWRTLDGAIFEAGPAALDALVGPLGSTILERVG